MQTIRIYNQGRPTVQPVSARNCASFFCRLRGLTFRRILPPGEALLLAHGRDSRLDAAITMVGVFFDLGIVWINTDGVVVDSCLARRWRLMYFPAQPARYVLEIAPERLPDFRIGDRVRFEEIWMD